MSIQKIVGGLLRLQLPIALVGTVLSIAWTRLLPYCAGLAVGFLLLRVATQRWVRTSADISMAVMGVMIVITLVITPLIELTLLPVLRLISGIGLFYAVMTILDRPDRQVMAVEHAALVLTIAGTAIALTAPISVDWANAKMPMFAPVYKLFPLLLPDSVHPNVMAGSLVLILPVLGAVVIFITNFSERIVWVGAGLLMFSVIVLTASRGGMMGLAAAIMALSILRLRRVGLGLIALMALVAVLLLVLPELRLGIWQRMVSDGVSGTISGREEIWSRAIYMIQDFPFTGIGMGLHEKLVEVMYPYFLNPYPHVHAHNLFLQIAVDLGIPGLIAWLGILVCVLHACWQAYRSSDPMLKALGAGLLASNVAMCVHGLTDAVVWGVVRTAPLVWGLWGVALAAGEFAGRYKTSAQSPTIVK